MALKEDKVLNEIVAQLGAGSNLDASSAQSRLDAGNFLQDGAEFVFKIRLVFFHDIVS